MNNFADKAASRVYMGSVSSVAGRSPHRAYPKEKSNTWRHRLQAAAKKIQNIWSFGRNLQVDHLAKTEF